MYAIVRAGGRQEKVAIGDQIEVDRRAGEPGDEVTLTAVLLVDGADVTSDAQALAKVTVSGQILDHTKGPKIVIGKFKNKTGYRKKQGFRSKLTTIRITDISVPKR